MFRGNNGKHTIAFEPRALMLVFLDILAITASFFLALWWRYEFHMKDIPERYLDGFVSGIGTWCLVCIVVFLLCKLYSSIWRFALVIVILLSVVLEAASNEKVL